MIVWNDSSILASATPAYVDYGGVIRPATGAEFLRLNRLGNRFRAAVTIPLETAEARREMIADLIAATSEGLRLPYPLQGVDQGQPGPLVVDGGGQAGTSLKLKGGTAGYIARKGYWLSIVDGTGQHYLYNIQQHATVATNGDVTLPIRPALRFPYANGAVVHLVKPMIEGCISGSELSWQLVRGGRIVGLSFTIEEVA